VVAFIIFTAVAAGSFGWRLRMAIFKNTDDIRFRGDIRSGFRHGGDLLDLAADKANIPEDRAGDVSTWRLFTALPAYYDQLQTDHDDGDFGMDYPPGRLFVMSLWARHVRSIDPTIRRWTRDHEETAEPMMRLNAAAAGASAVAMFFLVWVWLRRETVIPAESQWAWLCFGRFIGRPPPAPERRLDDPWWPCHGLLASIAAGVALAITVPAACDLGAAPDWYDYVAFALLLIALLASIRSLPLVHRAWACALAAGLMVWFDPSEIVVSHVWPQWDVWSVPFFITAALLASLDLWFLAGAVIGAGAMFKGQLLIIAPVLPLWALFGGRVTRLIAFSFGMALAAGAMLSPWLLGGAGAIDWTRRAAAAGVLGVAISGLRDWPPIGRWRVYLNLARVAATRALLKAAIRLDAHLFGQRENRQSAMPAGGENPAEPSIADALIADAPIADALIVDAPAGESVRRGFSVASIASVGAIARSFPWRAVLIGMLILFGLAEIPMLVLPPLRAISATVFPKWIAGAFVAVVIVVPWILPRRDVLTWLGGVLAAAIWMSAFAFSSSFSWLHVGFEYGARRWDKMQMGMGSFSSLPSILEQRFQWNLHDPAGAISLPMLHVDLDLQMLLRLIFFAGVALSAIGAAIHSRRNDPRVLIALAAPWVLFPTIVPQTSERYILMAAVISSGAIAASVGMSLMHVLLALLGAAMTMHQLLAERSNPDFAPGFKDAVDKTYPDIAWMLILIAAVFLFQAVAPRPRNRRAGVAPEPTHEAAIPMHEAATPDEMGAAR
jgi:hypothetical protein